MNILTTLLGATTGWKTYFVAAVAVALVAIEATGFADIPGFDPGTNWLEYILAATGLTTLRAAVKPAV